MSRLVSLVGGREAFGPIDGHGARHFAARATVGGIHAPSSADTSGQ